jgi:hypothetical protein
MVSIGQQPKFPHEKFTTSTAFTAFKTLFLKQANDTSGTSVNISYTALMVTLRQFFGVMFPDSSLFFYPR